MSTLKESRISPIYYLGRNPTLAEGIAERLGDRGLHIRGFTDLADLAVAIVPTQCPAVLLETEMVPAGQTLASLVRYLEMLFRAPPALLCIAPNRDPHLRLAALRAGTTAYFTPPFGVDQVAEKLAQISGAPSKTRYRVLIVDDEPDDAREAERILTQDNMQTQLVKDPMSVLDAIEDFGPDLIVMDLYMPDISGIELTTIIREHEAYFSIPIVFVSGEMIAEKQADALSVGGDQFVSKPLDARILITAVHSCIERSQRRWCQKTTVTNTDQATGFYNRAYFIKRLESMFSDSARPGAGFAVLLIEVDDHEALVERIGQAAADRLMLEIGKRVKARLAETDLLARYGAPGFSVIAFRGDEADFTELSQQLLKDIRGASLDSESRGLDLGVSIGIGLKRHAPDDAMTMLSRAETACRAAANVGGDGMKVHEPFVPRTKESVEETRLTELLTEALANDSFALTYQPILNLRQQNDARYEVLLRLRAPDGELIPPLDFLPTARHADLISAIDRWVLTHALAVSQNENQQGNRLRFFIHHSATTMAADDWIDWLRQQILDHDLIHLRPVLQLRLADIRDHLQLVQQRLEQLERLGVEVCLTGFDGAKDAFALLDELPVPIVKLTQQTIMSAGTRELKALTQKLHAADRQVVAPGIENPQTLGDVWSSGSDFIQGNFIQSPIDRLDFNFAESLLD